MLSTFENFYNNVIKTLNESVYSLPTFKNRITIENGEKVIRGSVDFSYQQLTELPDLSDVKVLGGFNCSYNRLQTLKGAPKYVSGNFYCNSNQLQTLEGAPKHIGVFFSCDNNSQLTTLKGLPKYIGGDLCWHDTKVTIEDFYENLLLSDVKGNPMYQDEDEGDHNYPESPMSNEEAYVNAEAYGIYNTPSEYTIDF